MAVIPKDDSITSKLRGKVGGLLFRQYVDKTVVSQMPRGTTKKKSIVQQFHLHHFRKAVRYAKSVLRDPALRAQMENNVPPGKRLYNYLVKLYYNTNRLMDEVNDQGPVSDVCRYVEHRFVTPPSLSRLLVSNTNNTATSLCAAGVLMQQAANRSKGNRLLNCATNDFDGMVKMVLDEMKKLT